MAVKSNVQSANSSDDASSFQPDVRYDVSPLFGAVPAPENITQLAAVLDTWARDGVDAWRGQADERWLIDSTVVRRWVDHRPRYAPPRPSEAHIAACDRVLIEETKLAGHFGGLGELQVLAKLRHHGAASRLLDATRNANVALWFACREHPRESGVLVGFSLRNCVELSSLDIAGPIEATLRAGEDQMMWWQPWGLSPRIAAQRAVMVLSRIVDEPWGSVRFGSRPLGPGRGAVPGAAIMLIRPELKRALGLSLQAVAGLGEGVLFPDFDGFAQAHASSIEFADPGVYALRETA